MRRDLDWEGCRNLRDLGGLRTPHGPTAFGVVVRGDNARKLSAAGWKAAGVYGIQAVLDLRTEAECAADPPPQHGFVHERLSLFAHFDDDPSYRAELLRRVDGLSLSERHQVLYAEALTLDADRFAQAFRHIAAADGGVLVHCVGGKDRTGLLAALLLRLVDVDREAIEADYVRSETRLRVPGGLPAPATSVPTGVVNAVLDDLEERHGSSAGYLLAAGVTRDEVNRIRRRLLPDAVPL